MTSETRKQQGKLWLSLSDDKKKKFKDMEKNYIEFKEEIDAELKPIIESVKEETKSKKEK